MGFWGGGLSWKLLGFGGLFDFFFFFFLDGWIGPMGIGLGWIKREYSRDSRDEFKDSPRDGFGLVLVLDLELDLGGSMGYLYMYLYMFCILHYCTVLLL